MSRLSITDIEKMTKSKYICTQTLRLADDILGDNKKHNMEFDIFDGFAYCADYKGKEYYMDFPKVSFINLAKDMAKSIREYLDIEEHAPIKETDILVAYNTLYCNSK